MTHAARTGFALALAAAAGVYQAVIASSPTNDDFMHVVLAQQVAAGDWPVRDFFDTGLSLMVWLSVAAQALVGYRLGAEAVLVAAMLAVSSFLVFRLVHRLSGSTTAAALSALLLMVAGLRGYSYPKVIVYAVGATLWWEYVWTPGRGRALALGAWTAAAFYFRPDHGAYMAVGVILAMLAAHGASRVSMLRLATAGGVTLALVAPFLVFVSAVVGLVPYVQGGLLVADAQHNRMNSHSWPAWPVRTPADVVRLDPASEFAPVVGVRWSAASPVAERDAVLARYGLTPVSSEDGGLVQQVRMSAAAVDQVRAFINEPIVEDTSGIERSQGAISEAAWPFWQRWRFSQPWLRIRLFPGVDEQSRAGEAVAALFFTLPVVAMAASPWLSAALPARPALFQMSLFAVFALVAVTGLTREPYNVRAVDGVVMPAILFGCCLAALWRAARQGRPARRAALGLAAVALALLVVKSVAVAGEFADRVRWLAGDFRSMPRLQGAWQEVGARLWTAPPLRFWDDQREPATLQLARYAQACVPARDRLLVLWFAPEVYYYADRLMASRNLAYVPGYEVPHEQEMTLAKVRRFAPPLVFADADLDLATRAIVPGVVDYVHQAYVEGPSVEEEGRRYAILVRRDAPVVRWYGEGRWPCFV